MLKDFQGTHPWFKLKGKINLSRSSLQERAFDTGNKMISCFLGKIAASMTSMQLAMITVVSLGRSSRLITESTLRTGFSDSFSITKVNLFEEFPLMERESYNETSKTHKNNQNILTYLWTSAFKATGSKNQTVQTIEDEMRPPFRRFHGKEPVYAIMVTGKDDFHCHLARNSIQSFLEQTYEPKFMIIVEDGNYSFAKIAEKHNNIVVVNARRVDNKRYKLGMLRNLGLNTLPKNNSLFVQWDDDDYHHPQYISMMYQRMEKHSADAMVLQEQVMYSFVSDDLDWEDEHKVSIKYDGILGTIMARDKGIRYKSHEIKREDATYVQYLKSRNIKLKVWKNHQAPEAYIRFVHGRNTWGSGHFRNGKRSIWRKTPPRSLEYLDAVLQKYDFQAWQNVTNGMPICDTTAL